jgi:hypothetical protein
MVVPSGMSLPAPADGALRGRDGRRRVGVHAPHHQAWSLCSGILSSTEQPSTGDDVTSDEEHMDQQDVLPDDVAKKMVWTLSPDRKTVRLSLPPLTLDGLPEPIKVDMDLDVATVDVILDRLVDLRSQMGSPEAGPSEGKAATPI